MSSCLKTSSPLLLGSYLLLAAFVLEAAEGSIAKGATPRAIKSAGLNDESHAWVLEHESEQPLGHSTDSWHGMSAQHALSALAVLLGTAGLIFFGKSGEAAG